MHTGCAHEESEAHGNSLSIGQVDGKPLFVPRGPKHTAWLSRLFSHPHQQADSQAQRARIVKQLLGASSCNLNATSRNSHSP